MNLSELRTQFIEMSGRDDLVNSDGSDNGADFYINAGQRMLDRKIDFRKSSGVVFKSLAVDGWNIFLEDCRSVDSVWASDTEERWELVKKDLSWLHSQYADTISETDSGDAAYWGISNVRGVDTRVMNNLATFFNHVVVQDVSDGLVGVVILPPTDTALTIEIYGKFYTPKLQRDGDSSWWSLEHEFTLLSAALFRLEQSYRNTEGARDYLNGIDLDLIDIDKDGVHEDNVNVDQLEG